MCVSWTHFHAWNVVFLREDWWDPSSHWYAKEIWKAAACRRCRDDLCICVPYCNVWRRWRGGGWMREISRLKGLMTVCVCARQDTGLRSSCRTEMRLFTSAPFSDERRQSRGGKVKTTGPAKGAGSGMLVWLCFIHKKIRSALSVNDMWSADSQLIHFFAPGGCKQCTSAGFAVINSPLGNN